MNSLQELNNFGAVSLDYVDARPSKVIFDREYPLTAVDQELTISSATVFPEPGTNIVEIINYQTANVRYRVTIIPGTANPLLGSTITWTSLPSGATLTQVGNQYTITGIHSVQDWEAVKYFIWNLPANYASYPLWYLNVEIIYYDSQLAQDIVRDWIVYDTRFFYVAQLDATANINTTIGINSPASINLNATANITAIMFNFIRFESNINATSQISADCQINNTELIGRSTVNAIVGVQSPAQVNINAKGTVSANLINSLNNVLDRSYTANKLNRIFETNTPTIDTVNPITDSFSITLSSNIGQFATYGNNPVSNLTITGSIAGLNPLIQNIQFYPNVNVSSSGTVSWAQTRNGILEFTRTINLSGIAQIYQPQVYTYSSAGNYTWTPTYEEVYYGGKVDYLIVGGGGCGGDAILGAPGGGGGGGFAKEFTNFTITQQGYPIVVGARGTRGIVNSNGYSGGGGTTSAFGTTAFGGQAGFNGTRPAGLSVGGAGGPSGIPINYSQSDPEGRFGFQSNGNRTFGGGGAGARDGALAGGDIRLTGGNGLLSSIPPIAIYVGGGGGGGSSSTTQKSGGLGNGASGGITVNGIGQNGASTSLLGGGGGGGATDSDATNLNLCGLGGRGGAGYIAIRVHS